MAIGDSVIAGVVAGVGDGLLIYALGGIIRLVVMWRAKGARPMVLEEFAWLIALTCWGLIAAIQFMFAKDAVMFTASVIVGGFAAWLVARGCQGDAREDEAPQDSE